MPPSVAREFFDGIVNAQDPVAKLQSLINPSDPTFEADWLDFKGEHRTDPKQRDKSNRSYWSEYLTAFANTGGGVLIWGIDARRMNVNGREIDCAGGEAPITDPVGLASKLNEWQGQATNPPLSGVEIKPYPLPGKPNEGFVVCYVPQGPLRPYQSLLTTDKQYYLRGGASNFVMDRAVLAAMFHPRSQAVFRVRANLEHKQAFPHGSQADRMQLGYPVGSADQVICQMELLNEGTATARAVVGRLTWQIPGTKEAFNAIGGKCWANSNHTCEFNHASPLHPGFNAMVATVSWKIEHRIIDQNVKRGFVSGDTPPYIKLELFCENQEPQTIELPFRIDELVNKTKLEVEATAEG